MFRFLVALTSLLFAAQALAADAETPVDTAHLYYGNALYYAYQGEWFEAIARLDAQRARARGFDGSLLEAPSSQIGPAAGWLS